MKEPACLPALCRDAACCNNAVCGRGKALKSQLFHPQATFLYGGLLRELAHQQLSDLLGLSTGSQALVGDARVNGLVEIVSLLRQVGVLCTLCFASDSHAVHALLCPLFLPRARSLQTLQQPAARVPASTAWPFGFLNLPP